MASRSIPQIVAAAAAGGAVVLLSSYLLTRPTSDEACHAECARARQASMSREWQPGRGLPHHDWQSDVSAQCRPRCISLMGVYP